jgi:DNA topoisomerase-1
VSGLTGYQLFEYINESGEICRVDSADVNRYIREISAQDFTAKDFRMVRIAARS